MALTIALSGDVVPAQRLLSPPPSAEAVYDLVRRADVAIGNVEMALTRATVPVQKMITRKAAPEIAQDVPRLGFGVVSIANNHTVDYGWPGLSETMDSLRASGLTVLGAGRTRDEAASPALLEAGGKRVGVVAFSCLTPAGMSAAEGRPGISPIHIETSYEVDPWYQQEEPGDPSAVRIRTRARSADLDYAIAAVGSLRAKCDLVVVTIHWGFGSGEALAEYQTPLGEALIDAGADIVHGHHPHAVHAIGFHRNRPIFYGPGTFMSQQFLFDAGPAARRLRGGMSPDGYVALVQAEPGALPAITLHPTTLDASYLPSLALGAAFDRIAERLDRLSRPHGAEIRVVDGVLIVQPSG